MRVCHMCGEEILQTKLIRLRTGFARIEDGEFVFSQEAFEDGDMSKWVHLGCADDTAFSVPTERRNGTCHLCMHQFEPEESPVSESVVYAEIGFIDANSTKMNSFASNRGTMVHFLCAFDNWELRLWEDQL